MRRPIGIKYRYRAYLPLYMIPPYLIIYHCYVTPWYFYISLNKRLFQNASPYRR